MICPDCKQAEMQQNRETIRYEESGLSNVVLKNIPIRHCPDCGNQLVSIPNLSGLHRYIAIALVLKPERVTPEEVSFLRKSLGWSKAHFSRKLHVRPEQVSRWESKTKPVPMSVQGELLLRTLVAMGQQIDDYKEHLEEFASSQTNKSHFFSMLYEHGDWQENNHAHAC